jgi:hypothetical protein
MVCFHRIDVSHPVLTARLEKAFAYAGLRLFCERVSPNLERPLVASHFNIWLKIGHSTCGFRF